MRYLPLTVLVSISLFVGAPAPAEDLVLAPYLEQVRDNHPALQAARYRASADAHRVAPAGAWEDPFVAIGPDDIHEADESGIIRYQISQTIPAPGKTSARKDVAAGRAASAQADLETTTREVLVVATQTFFRALLNEHAIDLNAELQELLQDAIESGKARYRAGDAAHHEWLLAHAELAVLQTDRVRLVSGRRTLQAQLNELRNKPPAEPIGHIDAQLSATAALDVDSSAVANSPEIRSLDGVVKAADAELRSTRLAYLPDVVLQGMVEQPRKEMGDPTWGVMVGVTVPVFWLNKQNELRAAALEDRRAALADKETLANRLTAEISEARQQLDSALETVALYEKSVRPATELALESARSSYAVGSGSLSELIVAARARQTQELEYLAARIDVELSKTRLTELLSSPPVVRLTP
ncbi:MAG: TolC family protein, partial [Thermomicrobiales bacterium]